MHTLLHSFSGADGAHPHAGLALGSDGSFYGTTYDGGASNLGTVFKITSSGVLSLLHSFNGSSGSYPGAGLVEGSDGHFYGTTQQGGASNLGTVFKITYSGTHSLMHSFNGTNGRTPYAGLVVSDDGSLYGTTGQGGVNNYGTVFKITSGGAHSLLLSFSWTDGVSPRVELVEDTDGGLYGTTSRGGQYGGGTVFKITASSTYNVVYNFDAAGGDGNPRGLLRGSDGSFYGTTLGSSLPGNGIIYKITAAGVPQLLYRFQQSTGVNPAAPLVEGSDGSFYGTTEEGGTSGVGTVFKVSPSGQHTTLHSFGGTTGSLPRAGLVEGSDGSFYGTTSSGTAYKISTSGVISVIHRFNRRSTGTSPNAGLLEGSDGSFYGTTTVGGANDSGTVYRLTASGVHTLLHSFSPSAGRNPNAALVEGSDGSFYGTTLNGGSANSGTVFRITPEGTHTLLRSFNALGVWPSGELVLGSDGSFYGMTRSGGTGSYGTVFKITSDGTETLLHSFSQAEGAYPAGGLVQGSDGNFYGTTPEGGAHGRGTLFKITPAGGFTLLRSFDSSSGINPSETPVFGSDGRLYGTAHPMVVWRYTVDSLPPVLTPVTIGSSNANPTLAKEGDTVTLSFTSNEPIQTPAVNLLGVAATVMNTSGNTWIATATVNAGTSSGAAVFSVNASDLSGNPLTVTATTDASHVTVDMMTVAPLLMIPAFNFITTTPISVSFTLPEAALPGSLKLALGAAEVTLSQAVESAGTHSFSFDPAHPTHSPEIASGGPVADGTYTVTLSYQDAAGNAAASASASNVTVDTTGPLGGTVSLSPGAAVTPSTLMTVDFAGWLDDRQPLSYSLLVDDVVVSAAGPSSSRNFTAPSFAGAFTLKARITDSLGNSTTVLRSFHTGISPQTAYDNATSAAGLSGPDAQANAILYNGDLSNLLKYAFNLDLTTPDRRTLVPGSGIAGLPVITVPSPGVMRVEYVRRIGSGLIYTPRKRAALDAGAWQPLTAPPQLTPIDTNWERVRHDEAFNPVTVGGLFGSVEVMLP